MGLCNTWRCKMEATGRGKARAREYTKILALDNERRDLEWRLTTLLSHSKKHKGDSGGIGGTEVARILDEGS